MTRRVPTHLAAGVVVGIVLALGGNPSRAETLLSVGIPAQPVDAALAQFAHQTGLQLVYVSHLTRARASRGAHAGTAPAAALTELLADTGLTFQFLNERTVRIIEAEPELSAATAPAPTRGARHTAAWSGVLSEVVVTGTRYPQPMEYAATVHEIPAAVSMVSGERLEMQHLGQLSDYAGYLPGVNADSGGSTGNTALNVRGIESVQTAATVSFYIDDVPMGPSGPYGGAFEFSLDLLPYDLERLEVWRGPQGTLTGADAFGGMVRYVLKAPSLGKFEARVGADIDTIYGAGKAGASVRAMVNAPLVEDRLALLLSAYDDYTPGYIDNTRTGATDTNVLRRYGARISSLWSQTDSLQLTLSALWQRIGSASHFDMFAADFAAVPGSGDAYILKAVGSLGDLIDTNAFLQPVHKSIDLYSLDAHWRYGPLEVQSVTAWSRTRTNRTSDYTFFWGDMYPQLSDGVVAAGLALNVEEQGLDKFSQEVRASAPLGTRLTWRLGGFYTHESGTLRDTLLAFDDAYQPVAFFAPALSDFFLANTFKEWALFGDLTWKLSDPFDMTAGIRYARDDQTGDARNSGALGDLYDIPGASSGRATTWMAAARYRVTPQVMLYARVATGAQPGTPNGFVPGIPPSVKAESLTNYETGLKAELPAARTRIDLAVFHMDWKDIQVNVTDDVGNSYPANGATAISQGLEFEGSSSPWEPLTVGLNAAYTHAVFTHVLPTADYILTGYQLPNVPEWNVSLTLDYAWALSGAWQAHAGGGFRWVGQQYSLIVESRSHGGFPTYEMPAYSVLDLNAAIAKGSLTLRAFARNVTDTRASVQTVTGSPSAPPVYHLIQPRTLGVGMDYRF